MLSAYALNHFASTGPLTPQLPPYPAIPSFFAPSLMAQIAQLRISFILPYNVNPLCCSTWQNPNRGWAFSPFPLPCACVVDGFCWRRPHQRADWVPHHLWSPSSTGSSAMPAMLSLISTCSTPHTIILLSLIPCPQTLKILTCILILRGWYRLSLQR